MRRPESCWGYSMSLARSIFQTNHIAYFMSFLPIIDLWGLAARQHPITLSMQQINKGCSAGRWLDWRHLVLWARAASISVGPECHHCGESVYRESASGLFVWKECRFLWPAMGYNVQIFADDIDENLLCAICSQVLQDAVVTPCGHSFCQVCLEYWLSKPGCITCPHCRSAVLLGQAKPVLALRNLIFNLRIHCIYQNRGCNSVVKLDECMRHRDECGYAPIKCAGCKKDLNKADLPEHQIRCEAISHMIEKSPTCSENSTNNNPTMGNTTLVDLSSRVSSLESHLQKLKIELSQADERNQQLGQDLESARQELEERRRQNFQHCFHSMDPSHDYGHSLECIPRLTSFLLGHRLQKPNHVETSKVYDCVKRCYDSFGHNRKVQDDNDFSVDMQERDEVHMLVATAQACTWFTENQKLNFHCWLQSIARHKQFSYIQQYSLNWLVKHGHLEYWPCLVHVVLCMSMCNISVSWKKFSCARKYLQFSSVTTCIVVFVFTVFVVHVSIVWVPHVYLWWRLPFENMHWVANTMDYVMYHLKYYLPLIGLNWNHCSSFIKVMKY